MKQIRDEQISRMIGCFDGTVHPYDDGELATDTIAALQDLQKYREQDRVVSEFLHHYYEQMLCVSTDSYSDFMSVNSHWRDNVDWDLQQNSSSPFEALASTARKALEDAE